MSRSALSPSRLDALLAAYRPPGGMPDELIAPGGGVRPVWRELLALIANATEDDLARRCARGDQYLRDAGVFFRSFQTGTPTERNWPLSHLPVLIGEDEWRGIETGLIQRADVLEALCADLYGENRLVREGHLPPALIGDNREWLRPLVGTRPRGGHFLHFIAFEIGRGPRGGWWVLGDRTQTPSGAGFALENRIATTRVFSDLYGGLNVLRLAPFFREFRDALNDLNDPGSRVAILTPGLAADTYLEHAYIARYLGLMLLEGEDLAVRDGRILVRTVAGLKPVSTLWRRLDASWADPLELEGSSAIGTPGLVSAIRAGSVTVVNALGAGVLETRALLAFMPRISEILTGEPLAMPNIATWWCGTPAERDYVKANAHAMTISGARSTRLPFDRRDAPFDTGGHEGQGLSDWIDRMGGRLVAQEAVRLSTAPVLSPDGGIEPRPMSLRVFLARTPDGWRAMPGGFARIGAAQEPHVAAMSRGGRVADVWVVADHSVPVETMLPRATEPFARAQPGVLPSRAADNLTWMGRYVERSEAMLRLLRAYHARLDEGGSGAPLVEALRARLDALGADPEQTVPAALHDTLAAAMGSAQRIRDRFSTDGWMALSDLVDAASDAGRIARPGDDAERAFGDLLRRLSGFYGLVQDNMYRFIGWRFLGIGRALERGWQMAGMLAAFADETAPVGGLDIAVELGDGVISHRRRYTVATNRQTVMDLLALDPLNPRSVMHQLDRIEEHISWLPGAGPHLQLTDVQRVARAAHTAIAVETPRSLSTAKLIEAQAGIARIAAALDATYLR